MVRTSEPMLPTQTHLLHRLATLAANSPKDASSVGKMIGTVTPRTSRRRPFANMSCASLEECYPPVRGKLEGSLLASQWEVSVSIQWKSFTLFVAVGALAIASAQPSWSQ